MKDKLLMIWAIVMITCLSIAFGYWIGDKALQIDNLFNDDIEVFEQLKIYIDDYIDNKIAEKEAIKDKGFIIIDPEENKPFEYFNPDWETFDMPSSNEEILFEFTTGGVLKDNFKPQLFLKITGTDLSRCFIDGRLKVDLNGEIYWVRLER